VFQLLFKQFWNISPIKKCNHRYKRYKQGAVIEFKLAANNLGGGVHSHGVTSNEIANFVVTIIWTSKSYINRMSVPYGVCVTYPLPESEAAHEEELQLEPVPPHHPSDWLQDSSSELDPPLILYGSFSDTNSFIKRAWLSPPSSILLFFVFPYEKDSLMMIATGGQNKFIPSFLISSNNKQAHSSLARFLLIFLLNL
jgi:hypothetical protein